jgi:hypothetical protein
MNAPVSITHTVEQFVDEHKVILNIFLVQFAKIRLHCVRESIEKLEYHCRVDILSTDSANPYIAAFDVKKRCTRHIRHRCANLEKRLSKYWIGA